jgi:heptosyltransferase-2
MSQREKILVVQTSFLGDVVLTTPLLGEIRRHFPEAELAVLCTPQAKALLEDNPDISEIIIDDKKGEGKGWKSLRRKAMELRSRRFTIAVSPHKSFRTALLLLLAGVPRRVGFRQSAGWFFYHHQINRDSTRHDVERNLLLLQAFGIDPAGSRRDLKVDVALRTAAAVEQLFRSLGIEREGLIFGVNPGSVWPTKRWTVEGYAELVVQLKQRHRCQILLFGAPEDNEIVTEIQGRSGHAGIDLVGKIDIRGLACALDWCDVFITNDSGPMHVAVARGIPVVAIFCATTPELGYYPYSSRAVIVEKDLPCRPCGSHGGRRCPLATEDCMRLIKAGDVLQAVERLLRDKGRSHTADVDSYSPQHMTF